MANIGAKSVTEGINLNFNISATDPDATTPSFSTSTLPSGATFVNNGNGIGTFNWTPGYTQSAVYNLTFRASDGSLVDSEVVQVNVNQAENQAPVLATIGSKSTTEGVNLNFSISGTDPDGTFPFFTSSTLPTGATLVNGGNGTATFNWTPGGLQGGVYNVTFRATDGSLVDTERVEITVNETANQAPVLAPIGPKTAYVNQLLTVNLSATDPDGTFPTFGGLNLPPGADIFDNGNGTGYFQWTPGTSDAGLRQVTFFATDFLFGDSEAVNITVTDTSTSCCIGIRGDLNNDGTNLNILDLTFIVDRIFRGGPPAVCPQEADVNSDGTSSNILDLTFVVNRPHRHAGA